jgi:hypothetical protein
MSEEVFDAIELLRNEYCQSNEAAEALDVIVQHIEATS